MLSSTLERLSRRDLLVSGAAAGVGAVLSGAAAAQSAVSAAGLDTSAQHLDLFRRMSASADDGAEVVLRYSGTVFGTLGGSEMVPLYGMEGYSPVRTYSQADGKVLFMANEVGLFTDISTGAVLESWKNPFTDEWVEVFHLRNGPLVYAIDPSRPLNTAGWRFLIDLPGAEKGFRMPIIDESGSTIVNLDAQARRKNPLQPNAWPRESTGETLIYSEHNSWHMNSADVRNPKVASIPVFAAWHSHKMWRPWMLMGTRPGHIYNHLFARKISGVDALPRPQRAYLERHFPSFLKAPTSQSGTYKDDATHFMEKRSPK